MKAMFLALVAVSGALAGCSGSPERTITPDEEKMYRNPPKDNPPAGYRGNDVGTPTPPPAGATGG